MPIRFVPRSNEVWKPVLAVRQTVFGCPLGSGPGPESAFWAYRAMMRWGEPVIAIDLGYAFTKSGRSPLQEGGLHNVPSVVSWDNHVSTACRVYAAHLT